MRENIVSSTAKIYDGAIVRESVLGNIQRARTIGNDVWIGANVCILRGIHIGDGAIIGAGSAVTHDVPTYSIVVGNPGRVLKYRFDQGIIDALLDLKWWDWPEERLEKNKVLLGEGLTEDTVRKLKEEATIWADYRKG